MWMAYETNALRPARDEELRDARVIKVDLASGVTELHINKCGLLSSHPCQVIIPAGYLVQLGFSIAWKRKGCVIRRRGRVPLEVKVVKGCPLVSREKALQLLYEYEVMLEPGILKTLTLLAATLSGSLATMSAEMSSIQVSRLDTRPDLKTSSQGECRASLDRLGAMGHPATTPR